MKENLSSIELSLKEKSGIFNSFAEMYSSQIPLAGIFKSITSASSGEKIRAVCSIIASRLDKGYTLKESIKPVSNALGKAYSALLAAGENSGKLEDVLFSICRNITKQQEIKSSLTQALAYPGFILLIMYCAVMLIQFFILPAFKSVYDYEQTIDTGALLYSALIKMAAGCILPIVFIAVCIKIPAGKRRLKKIIFSLPVIKGILRNYYYADFFYIMSLAYEAGVPAGEGTALSASVIGIESEMQKIKGAAKMIEGGRSITKALGSSGLFSNYAMQQISAGEEAGKLGIMYKKAAEDYERTMDSRVKIMIKLLAPSMLVIAGMLTAVLAGKVYTEYYKALFSMF